MKSMIVAAILFLGACQPTTAPFDCPLPPEQAVVSGADTVDYASVALCGSSGTVTVEGR